MGAKITIDKTAVHALWEAAKRAAEKTAQAVHSDLIRSQTMPYNVGTMQNSQTFVDSTEDGERFTASVVTDTDSPQARRLYFHPEYHFQKANNPNAGGEWLEPYLSGEKSQFAETTFAELYQKEAGL